MARNRTKLLLSAGIALSASLVLVGCFPDECVTDADCGAGQFCIDGGGVFLSGASCSAFAGDTNATIEDIGVTDIGVPDDTAITTDDTRPPQDIEPDEPEPDTSGPEPDTSDTAKPEVDAGNGDDDEPETILTCEDTPQPDRCTENASSFDDWGLATHINQIAIADSECCFDFDDSGEANNMLSTILAIPALDVDVDEVNADIQQSINQGNTNLVFEHDGLEEPEVGQNYIINVLNAVEIGASGALIDPLSFDEGVHPISYFPNALTSSPADLIVTAGPATIPLPLDLMALLGDGEMDADVDVPITNAMLEANISLSTGPSVVGVHMSNGTLGGMLRVEDLATGFNEVGSNCNCLGYPSEAVSYQGGEVDCDLDGSTEDYINACDASGERACKNLAEVCSVLFIVGGSADVAVDGEGPHDAISIGVTFSGMATQIAGVEGAN